MEVKFSIITICLNEEDRIQRTMQSVYKQTYRGYEHIIVDGESTDKTLQCINDCKKYYTAGALKVYSQRDRGIYDAMNKGIHYAEGQVICFMNGGDEFYDEYVLEKVAREIDGDKAYDLYYGDAVTVYPNGRERNQYKHYKWEAGKNIKQSALMPCHQAIFALKKCFENNMFDLDYKLRAELKWFNNCNLNNISMKDMGVLICKYSHVGTSVQVKNYILSDDEKQKILEEGKKNDSNNKIESSIHTDIRERCMNLMLDKWLALKQEGKSFDTFFLKHGYNRIAVYGYGILGNHLVTELEDSSVQVKYLIDREKKYAVSRIPVYSMEDILTPVDTIVVTVPLHFEHIANELKKKVQCPIIALDDILEELWFI